MVSGPQDPAVAEASGLSLPQARYGLRHLVNNGLVVREGGQGDRTTAYRKAR